jgi:Flp pilus assembly secretin CpaC
VDVGQEIRWEAIQMKTACWVLTVSVIVAGWTSHAQQAQKPGPTSQVEVKAFYMSISKKVAAEWGLDGGPATAPDKTPLGRAIPATVAAPEAQKLVTALRQTEGAQVLASATVVTMSGNTAISRNNQELKLPESWTKEGQPSFGEAEHVGIILEVTPTVEPEKGQVNLDLRPQLTRLVGYTDFGQNRMPVVSVCTAETKITLKPGSTRILAASSPVAATSSPVTLLSPEEASRSNDHVTVLLVAVDLVAD